MTQAPAQPQVSPTLTADALRAHGFSIGIHTYGVPQLHWWGEPATLSIGRYTSIANGVQIFLGGNHRTDWVTTYPFNAISAFPEAATIEGHPATKGDVRIGSDVWLGADCKIMSGLTIGDGAVVGAGAVVTKDVPPYTIVAGNPARAIRTRFDPATIARLLEIGWWGWDEYKIRQAIPLLQSSGLDAFFEFAKQAHRPGRYTGAQRKVFDCVMYNGEADVYAIRLNELASVVDHFIVVEADKTHSGLPREQRFDPSDRRFAPFSHRIRHVMVRDFPETDDAWVRENFQRNAITRGLADAAEDDLILLSDADEIPRAWAVAFMASRTGSEFYGLVERLSFFYLNYCLIGGPVAQQIWGVAFPKSALGSHTPQELRIGIQRGQVAATALPRSGWHFSYMFDVEGVRRKIKEFAHQEYNTPEFLAAIDVDQLVRARADMYDAQNIWDVLDEADLPKYVLANRAHFARYLTTP